MQRDPSRQDPDSTPDRDPLSYLKLESLVRLSASLQQLIHERLWLKVLLAMALGVGVGLLLAPRAGLLPAAWSVPLVNWLTVPGRLFLALIPAAGAVLLIGVDRILDMSRTAVNVMGDLVACVILERGK
jgi:Na+/H+-dicarboxylate symporter